MRRFICLFISLATLFVLLAGCKTEDKNRIADESDWTPTTYKIVNNLEGVAMTVKERTVTPTGLTVVLENNTDGELTYGEFFELEKEISETWYKVPVIVEGNYGFNDIGYDLLPGESREWETDWNWLYGSLKPGKYRIIKDILVDRAPGDYDEYYLAAEFILNSKSGSDSADN